MKLPHFLSNRLTAILALGCALLAFAPLQSAQAQIKVVALNSAGLDKLGKFVEKVNADADTKAAIEEMGKDQDIGTTVISGGSINDAVNSKYPKAAAAFKSGGFTPDEFNSMVMSLAMASTGSTDGTSDAAIAKANVDFYNANKDKVEKIMGSMK